MPWRLTFFRMIRPSVSNGSVQHLPWYLRILDLAAPSGVVGGVFGGPFGIVIGVLLAAGIAIAYSILAEIWSLYLYNSQQVANLAEETKEGEKKEEGFEGEQPLEVLKSPQMSARSLFKPSVSQAYTWDMSVFLAGMSFALIGFAIGGPLGAGIGASMGIAVGLTYAFYAKYIAISYIENTLSVEVQPLNQREGKEEPDNNQNQPIPQRHLLNESIHDVPLYARTYPGAVGGSKIGPQTTNIIPPELDAAEDIPDEHFISEAGTLTGAIIAIIYPYVSRYLAIAQRKIFNFFGLEWLDKIRPQRGWWRESTMDMPIYARIFVGIICGVTIGVLVFPELGILGGILMSCCATVLSPYFFALVRNDAPLGQKLLVAGIAGVAIGAAFFPFMGLLGMPILAGVLVTLTTFFVGLEYVNTQFFPEVPDDARASAHVDVPWYFRVFTGLHVAGVILAVACDILFPGMGNMLIFTLAMSGYAVIQPMLNAIAKHIPILKDMIEAAHIYVPPYKRIAAGGVVGGMLGSVFGYFFQGGLLVVAIGVPVPIIPLGVLGGFALGVFIGTVVCYLYPYIKALILKLLDLKSGPKGELDISAVDDFLFRLPNANTYAYAIQPTAQITNAKSHVAGEDCSFEGEGQMNEEQTDEGQTNPELIIKLSDVLTSPSLDEKEREEGEPGSPSLLSRVY